MGPSEGKRLDESDYGIEFSLRYKEDREGEGRERGGRGEGEGRERGGREGEIEGMSSHLKG